MRNVFLIGVAAALFVACDNTTKPVPVVVATPAELFSGTGSIVLGGSSTYASSKADIEADIAELNFPCTTMAFKLPSLPALASMNTDVLSKLNPTQMTQEFSKLVTQAIVVTPTDTLGNLPRGIYDYSAGCVGVVPTASDDSVVKWKTKTGNKSAQVTFDWDGSGTGTASPTVDVWAGGYQVFNHYIELPTKARVLLTVDGAKILEVSFDASYRKHATIADAYVLTPNNATLKITANSLAGKKFLDVSASLVVDAAGVRTEGTVNAANKSDTMVASWNINAAGTPAFDSNNNINGIAFAGTSSVSASLTHNTKAASLAFNFSDVNPASVPGGKFVSAKLSDGTVKVDGKIVTFSGMLDDANKNCVPGENVSVQFKDETKTLEQLFINNGIKAGACP